MTSRLHQAVPFPADSSEIDRSAFNAAFHELGLRWFWDSETYSTLAAQGGERERVRSYLEGQQAHLLRAYDAEFLSDAILRIKQRYRLALARSAAPAPRFEWNDPRACEIGA